MGVADDDIGGFIRTLMGDRGAKRRAALRDAVRAADERFATGTHQLPVVAAPQVHENVSEIILTKMNSGVTTEELLPDRFSVPNAAPSSISAISPPPVVTGQGATDQALSPRPRRTGLFIGAVVAVAAAAVAFIFLRPGSGAGASGSAAAAPPSGAPVAAISAPPAAPLTVAPVELAKPAASATSTVVSINDLPNADEKKKATVTTPGVKATPSSTADPGKAPRSVSTQWVPSVQNPGF